ncbi:hypothetical protein FJR45_08965 [Sulfurimonas sediminis]|uniref:Glycosyltransferase RgtA/B/C/D-like domain-containing protein n=1 Tax=Sulfurimonas sediminis TaxID=2590020 RepID=A0A7M1B2V3_9BACT|nr:hypothetical protein [Sulfurimonas sediminis]QOP44063.1 hypothetical protein FJR45_08965 [Sulfurimonas sediminis]
MKYRIILFLILGLDASILIFQTTQISISPSEASLLYGDASFLQQLVKLSLKIFGQNDFALRFVMILLHLLSAWLLYVISAKYLALERNRLWLVAVFVLLPGVVSAALVVSHAGLIIFGLFLYVYVSQKLNDYYVNMLLFLYALLDAGFVYLFVGLAIFYLFQKNKILFLYNLFLAGLSVYIYGLNISGVPSGHFLDTIGVYSAIFTPVIFIYIFYTLYRGYLNDENDKIWYIASTALLFSLLLSFRQRVELELFAPYLILALPLAAKTFAHSYRVRLTNFRKRYRAIFVLAFVFLIFNTLIVMFNKELYLLLDNPKKHFAYKMHIAKKLATKLKAMNISCVKTSQDMQKRLKFYFIDKCDENVLQELQPHSSIRSDVTIRYKNKILYKANVTKINNK